MYAALIRQATKEKDYHNGIRCCIAALLGQGVQRVEPALSDSVMHHDLAIQLLKATSCGHILVAAAITSAMIEAVVFSMILSGGNQAAETSLIAWVVVGGFEASKLITTYLKKSPAGNSLTMGYFNKRKLMLRDLEILDENASSFLAAFVSWIVQRDAQLRTLDITECIYSEPCQQLLRHCREHLHRLTFRCSPTPQTSALQLVTKLAGKISPSRAVWYSH